MTQPPSHPLKFLLYLEWLLLGIVAVSELGSVNWLQLPRAPLLNGICLSLFAGMGFRLPPRDRPLQLAYTAAELALILVMSLIGGIRLMPLLYIVLVIRNCLIFTQGTRTLITLLAFGLAGVTQWQRLVYWLPSGLIFARLGLIWLMLMVLFGLVVLFLQLLVTAVLAERQSRDQLAIANTQLRAYALQVEAISTLQERNRIARDIHDALGHSLTAFNLHLEAALRLLSTDPAAAIALLQQAKHLGDKALQEVRHSVTTLRTDPLQGVPWETAIANLVTVFQRSTGITPQLQIQLAIALPPELKLPLYRITQEALTNIAKYAQATEVMILVQTTPTQIVLQIVDNGQGFDPTQTTTGFGLRGMQERTLALGGAFQLQTAPTKGCRITAGWPYPLPLG